MYVFLGITASFQTGRAGLNFAAVLLIRGQVNLAGIISASISMGLSLTDEAGTLVGRGHYSISVSICWCFALSIDMEVRYPLGSGSGQRQQGTRLMEGQQKEVLLAALMGPGIQSSLAEPSMGGLFAAHPLAPPAPDVGDALKALIQDYVAMTEAA